LFSHLRKCAPRDGLVDADGPVAEIFMDARRIIRRGSPYGQPFDPSAGGARGIDAPRGLLFISYQADLVDQFEFMQIDWANSADFPPARAPYPPGPDTMISGRLDQINDGVVNYECAPQPVAKAVTPLQFSRFVRTEGALYTIVPSISTLRLLAQGDLIADPPADAGIDEILPIADLQRFAGVSHYWLLRRTDVVPIAVADGSDDTDHTDRPVSTIDSWPALSGISRIAAVVPIPDMQRGRGKSYYWVFHTIDQEQVYRIISIADGRHTSVLEAPDRGLDQWRSLHGVSHVDAFLPIPDMHRTDGNSYYWVFHTGPDGQSYRVISIADGQQHTDTQERHDEPLTGWQSLTGVTTVDAFLPVPAMQRAAGKSHFWVFHGDRVRTISIADGTVHADTMVRPDRPLSEWVTLPASAGRTAQLSIHCGSDWSLEGQ
jgi:hypothetical protein